MAYQIRYVYFPYCLEKQPDGSWVLLNRNYKPVGFNTGDFVEYQDHPVSMSIKGLTTSKLKKLSWKDETPTDRVYLYNDACTPNKDAKSMAAYLKKLEILLKLSAQQ